MAEAIELACGIPQGSPLSPILYLLATAALYQLPGATQRYRYADDTAILFVGETLEETAANTNKAITTMERWGRENGFSFDVKKTEVIHFSRRMNRNYSVAVYHQNHEVKPAAAMKWLGVWLDPKLIYTVYIQRWAYKVQGIIHYLRNMNNTVCSISVVAACRTVWVVVMPTMLYGVDVWYPGKEKV